MYEVSIISLNNRERRKLKKLILNLKINVDKNKNFDLLIQKEQTLLTQIKDNKQKRIICIEENTKRKISNKTYEKLMNDYELRGNELELESNLIEKEIKNRNYFFRRLDYLHLILSFYDGADMSLTINGNEKKNVNIIDIYNSFLNHILEEKKESLEIEHKIMQLYMLINNTNHSETLENSKFYLSAEEKNNTLARILENREEIIEVNNNSKNIDKVDIEKINVSDFFDTDIDNVYKHIFGGDIKNKKKI